jgi:acyl-CoA thioester hydrolase
MMSHVNNAEYFSYVELSRLKYFDTVVGASSDWHDQHGLILAHFEIDFRQAASFDDIISVYTRCSRLGTKSFDLDWVMVKDTPAGEAVLAEGKAVIACYDYEKNSSMEIPADKRQMIEKYEGI